MPTKYRQFFFACFVLLRFGAFLGKGQGAGKNQIGDPRGGWVSGSEAKKGPGSVFFRYFFMVFLNSPHRKTPKNVVKTKSRNK
jgi:hypothetical protein